jgi:hypothetical protein
MRVALTLHDEISNFIRISVECDESAMTARAQLRPYSSAQSELYGATQAGGALDYSTGSHCRFIHDLIRLET